MMKPADQQSTVSAWLFKPFLFLGGARGMGWGAVILILHIPLALLLDIRFDGALDIHLAPDVDVIYTPIVDLLIAWGSMVICMYLAAKLSSSPIRLIDIAGAVAIARVPLLLSIIPALFLLPDVRSAEEVLRLEAPEMVWLMTAAFVTLIFLIWLLVLLFHAFKINSNLKGARLWGGYLASVLAAEGLSLGLNYFI